MVMSQAAIDALMAQQGGSADPEEEAADAAAEQLIDAAPAAEAPAAEAAPAQEAPPAVEAAPAPPAEAAPAPAPEAAAPPPAPAPEPPAPAVEPSLENALTPEERAIVEAAAGPSSAPIAIPQQVEEIEAAPTDDTGVKMRRWSASATPESDQLKERVQELEDKLTVIEATSLSNAGSDAGSGVDAGEIAELRSSIEQVSKSLQVLWKSMHELTEHAQGSLGFAAKQTFDCPECGSHGTVSVPVACTYCGYESEWGFFPED